MNDELSPKLAFLLPFSVSSNETPPRLATAFALLLEGKRRFGPFYLGWTFRIPETLGDSQLVSSPHELLSRLNALLAEDEPPFAFFLGEGPWREEDENKDPVSFVVLSRNVETPLHPVGYGQPLFFPLVGTPRPDASLTLLSSLSPAALADLLPLVPQEQLDRFCSMQMLPCVLDPLSSGESRAGKPPALPIAKGIPP